MVWLVLPSRSRYSTRLNPKLFGGPVVAGVAPDRVLPLSISRRPSRKEGSGSECRLLAQSGHANRASGVCFRGAKRTWLEDGAMSAYDPMYGPAVRCKKTSPSEGCAVLHQCIRPWIGAFLCSGPSWNQRACDLVSGQASKGHLGHQCSHAPGRPILHLVFILSQTSAGKWGFDDPG
jgi:hypothetical protein